MLKRLEDMTPEQRAFIEAERVRRSKPEYRDELDRFREEIRKEVPPKGTKKIAPE